VPGTLARYGAAVAAVLFGMVGSAAWADDPSGPRPLASPQDWPEVPSAGRAGEPAWSPASDRSGSARRPFLLTWADGREAATGDVGLDRLAAAQLVIDYLNHWSSPREGLEAVPGFYAGRVRFHGRVVGVRDLLAEKRHFARRWPDRTYAPRIATMRADCRLGAAVCLVRTEFDFSAASPVRRARSTGRATLELAVTRGDQPRIVSETSHVIARGAAAGDGRRGG
jgi:hypothetical protein